MLELWNLGMRRKKKEETFNIVMYFDALH